MSATNTSASHHEYGDIFEYAQSLGFGDIHIKFDQYTGMCAIIAVHSTKRGPALGGCRFIEYDSIYDAINDATRLARGMSYKTAIAGLDCGGGKAVVIRPKKLTDRTALFYAFGNFINDLAGRYITAMDSGTQVSDMDAIAHTSPYVASASMHGDPSPFTAYGVKHGMRATLKYVYGKDSFDGVHVAIQGLGHVGRFLAEELHELGAQLTVCDTRKDRTDYCQEQFNAKVVGLDDIYDVDCDIFSPCALGGIIDDNTIPRLKARIIAGAANNQLERPEHGTELFKRGILYAPDYVINGGGIIYALYQYNKIPIKLAKPKVIGIYDSLTEIFERSHRQERSTHLIANELAEEHL